MPSSGVESWMVVGPDGRAEAHTVRLALTYALLDCSERICLEHLEAALAVWRYSAASAHWILGDALGDPTADELWSAGKERSAASAHWIFGDALGDPTADELWSAGKERPAGLTRTEVSELFSRTARTRTRC